MNTIIKYEAKSLKTFTARTCSDFIHGIAKFQGDFGIQINNSTMVDARSILGLFSLLIEEGQFVIIYVNIPLEDNGDVSDFLLQYFDISNNTFHSTEELWYAPNNGIK